ncbi:MAG: LysM peptidoglycan-binding domain-containing protein [Desulfobacteraceae bacterium]
MKIIKRIVLIIAAIGFLCHCGTLSTQKGPKGKGAGTAPFGAADPSADPQDLQSKTALTDSNISGEKGSVASLTYPQTAKPSSSTAIITPPFSNDGDPALDETQGTDSAADTKEGQNLLDEALDYCELAQSFWQKGELENALEALDNAYSLIVGVDTKQDVKLIQQKEDLRFLISRRILEIYASRNIVVNGHYDEIPLELNAHVEKELKRFTGYEKDFFIQSYARSGRYRPYILEALRKAGLPEELAWLPLIESGFKVTALSRARALGLWQFIPSTGYKFGLKRDRYIDERIDFIKATDAAITYLKELHSIFGDWATVLAAYNCGEGRVLKVIRTQNVNYLDNFWDLYQRLPHETARYVPRFYATLHIVKNPEKYGFKNLSADPPLEWDTVAINRQVHLKDVAKSMEMSLKDLKGLNPELRYSLVPPESYTLRVPKGTQDDLLAKLETIPTSKLPQRTYVYHRVRRGQTLSTIARRYRTSVRAIMRANNMRRSHYIRTGKRLKIPQRGYTFSKRKTRATKRVPVPASGTHYVRKGDSLWIIAKRYGTTVQSIRKLNQLSSNRLYIGQPLKIPGFKPEPMPTTSQLSTYSVQRGDSPYTIALKHNMALERLLRINQLTPRSKIYPGQKLFIE